MGIERDLPFSKYHDREGWGASALKDMRVGPPALVLWRQQNPSEETDATRLGTACHARILEPARFYETYAMKPDGMNFSTKEGKAWRAEQGDKSILTAAEQKTVEAVFEAFYAKAPAAAALTLAEGIEVSMFWADPDCGEPLKGRPDFYDGEYVYDLKISRHADERSVAFRAYAEGWMSQLAHYRAGLNALGVPVKTGRLIVIGPKPPQALRVYCVEVKEAALDVLALENAKTVERLRECRLTNKWPGTPDAFTVIEPPLSALDTIVQLDGVEEVVDD